MKHIKFVTVLVLVITMSISCNKNKDNGIIENSHDCDFVQDDDNLDALIDDTERMLMKECKENSLTFKSDIELNLIGEWELTGFGGGWIPTNSKPCGLIIISEDELTDILVAVSLVANDLIN